MVPEGRFVCYANMLLDVKVSTQKDERGWVGRSLLT